MRQSYPGYQSRKESEVRKIWEEGVFAFDAGALLDLYRVSESTLNQYLQTLESLQERVWLPHQAGQEFYANRETVLATGLKSITKIPAIAEKAVSGLKAALQEYRHYRWIDVDGIAKLFDQALEETGHRVKDLPRHWHGLQDYDVIEEKLSSIFTERVGVPFPDMDAIYVKAERRFSLQLPPGFKEGKEDYRKFGDIIIWFQLLDYAKQCKKSIIWITADTKEDWWLRDGGKARGPRPELIQEMHLIAGVSFQMYSPDQFLKHAASFLKIKPSTELNEAAEELQEVAKETRKVDNPSINFFSVHFHGRMLWQFTCPRCGQPYTIVWEKGPESSPDTLFQLHCPSCDTPWQAKASEGVLVGRI